MNTLLTLLIAYIFLPYSVLVTPEPQPEPVVQPVAVEIPATPAPTATPSPTPKTEVLGAASDNLVTVANRVRKENGCKRNLVAINALNKAAKVEADRIVTDWSHNGYAETARKYFKYRKIGENLARNFSNDEEIVNAWLNSPTHRAVLLDCSYKYAGVGRNGSHVAMYYGY